ncbi:MAG: type II methionyl aminopeptidase [Candidatus Altiarchaeales archaeon]|nr:type II methionyl aminopeptidase [Candidatus Altiarchaeales archaeon]
MEQSEREKILKAGKIASKVRRWSMKLVKAGAKAVDIADEIEAKIIEENGGLAFPANVCINDVAAHYAPKHMDKTVLGEGDVVSIDLGVHVDGYIGDTAYTIDLSAEHPKLLEANQKALDETLSMIKPGCKVADIGAKVYETMVDAGYKPIENLSGHEVKQYDLHAGLSIPNIKVPYDWEVEEDMVLAIEPFATDGYGRVIESRGAEIYSQLEPIKTRDRQLRGVIKHISKREGLPFTSRWYAQKVNPLKLPILLNQLTQQDVLKSYPPLREKEGGCVSQFEHTILVTEKGCVITTE